MKSDKKKHVVVACKSMFSYNKLVIMSV